MTCAQVFTRERRKLARDIRKGVVKVREGYTMSGQPLVDLDDACDIIREVINATSH
jgi:hypothetical protein